MGRKIPSRSRHRKQKTFDLWRRNDESLNLPVDEKPEADDFVDTPKKKKASKNHTQKLAEKIKAQILAASADDDSAPIESEEPQTDGANRKRKRDESQEDADLEAEGKRKKLKVDPMRPGETFRSFNRRLAQETREVLLTTKRIREKRKEYLKKKQQKNVEKKRKKQQQAVQRAADDWSKRFTDYVAFGEVAGCPPTFTAIPKKRKSFKEAVAPQQPLDDEIETAAASLTPSLPAALPALPSKPRPLTVSEALPDDLSPGLSTTRKSSASPEELLALQQQVRLNYKALKRQRNLEGRVAGGPKAMKRDFIMM